LGLSAPPGTGAVDMKACDLAGRIVASTNANSVLTIDGLVYLAATYMRCIMPESETVVVFRILGVLADRDGAMELNDIANAARLDQRHTERFMEVLEHAGAVNAEATPTRSPGYTLTGYGLARLVGTSRAKA
jgi:predicted transcriptional regulator